jgi:chromosome partitioning protein
LSAPIIAFFNNKGGVGKTTLVYHLAWMFADLGLRVLAADLDPQANLTAAFLGDEILEDLWERWATIYTCVEPLVKRTGDVLNAELLDVDIVLGSGLSPRGAVSLVVGDLRLSGFEDLLATGWSECRGGQPGGFVVSSSFWRILTKAAVESSSDLVLLDLGPNLGAINRAALLAADYLVVPLAADLFSLQGMKNLGPTVLDWKNQWARILQFGPVPASCPPGRIRPIGYVVQQHSVRLDRPVKSYEKWMARIPAEFRCSVLGNTLDDAGTSVKDDPWCLALLKHYHSLMPMAQEAHKPMFHLKVADGAIGSHFQAAQNSGKDFEQLARRIADGAGIKIPQFSRSIA